MAIPTYVPPIISLFALVVPVLNLLRVLFETADGYRKCSEAAISPWLKLRWRRWSWSEFGFEVHFVTPKLELQDISETRMKEASYRECFLTLRDRVPRELEGWADDTNPRPTGSRKPQPWYRRSTKRHWNFSNSAKRAHALVQSGRVLDSSLTPDFDNRIINMERVRYRRSWAAMWNRSTYPPSSIDSSLIRGYPGCPSCAICTASKTELHLQILPQAQYRHPI
jgi:hypothetical protein